MKKNRMTMTLTAVLLTLSLLAGCGGGSQQSQTPSATGTTSAPATPAPAPPKDVTIRIGLNADPPRLDPHQSSAAVDRQVYQSLYDKLVDLDKGLNIVPMLAEKWTISDDGKVYTFNLRRGVKFHDGTDFDAEAVRYNFERMNDPKLASPRRSEIASVDKVEVVDSHTVKISLKTPFAGFLAVLSDRAGMMVSPTAAKAAGVDFNNNPVGTGPFKFKDRVKGDSITLVKNESYWQPGLPKANTVIFKTLTDENVKLVNLQSGQLDIIDTVPPKQIPQLRTDNRLVINIGAGLGYQGIWMNMTQPPLNNKKLRQAVWHAIDREALVKVVFGEAAVAGYSPFPPGTPANDPSYTTKYDLELAKRLVAESGVANPSITLKFQPSPTEQQVGTVIQDMLSKAGIKVTLQGVEFGQFLSELGKKDYEAGRLGWSGRPDPDGNIFAFLYTGTSNNYSGFSNPQVDKLLNDSRMPTDMAKRKPMFIDIMKIVQDEVPFVYLYHLMEVKGLAPNVEGYVHVPDGMIRTVNLTKK